MLFCKLLLYASVLFSYGASFLEETKGPLFINSRVICAKNFMQLHVKLNPNLWRKIQTKLAMHLIDIHCKPFFVNSTHVFLRTPLYGCGTKLELTQDHVIFTNSFKMREEVVAGQLVSFIPDVEIGFRCTYARKKISLIAGALQLDKLHSSPEQVTTYFGLPVELRCTFKYGVPPVRVVISHEGKIIANQENGTQTVSVAVGRKNDEFGLYTCIAEDGNNVKFTHNMNVRKIDPSTISTDGKTVTCTPHEMQLTLDRLTYPWLQPKHFDMYLVDNRCRPYHVNFTHIIVKTTYGDCKTVAYNSSYDVTYRNNLMAFVKARSGILITRVPDVYFPFQCQFNHKERASISSKLIEDTLNYSLEPLASDKRKSTPMIVKSFKGFGVRLVCAFKGGVPPITITLTKGGRSLTEGVVVKGKVLYGRVKTNLRAAFGSYECIAADVKGNRVKQRITLQKAGPRDMTSDGLTVECKNHFMEVTLSRLVYPWLDPSLLHMSLIQSNCTEYDVTDAFVRMQVPLAGCGTTVLRKNKFVLKFRNVFIAKAKRPRGFSITYLPQIHFPFVCAYEMTRLPGRTMLQAIEPLALDASESSSNTIFSPPNMAVKMRCVFRGGEPPIQVRISRLKETIAHAQGRTLGFLLNPRRVEDGGRYVCRAIDARKKSVTHAITLKVPANRVIFNKGANIDCGSQFITIILDRAQYPWFNARRMRMHLNDPSCQPFENNTHVSFKIPLGGCGSRHITTSRKVMFFNRVFIVNKPYHIYRERTGKSIMEIHFYCKYKRTDSPSQKIKGFL